MTQRTNQPGSRLEGTRDPLHSSDTPTLEEREPEQSATGGCRAVLFPEEGPMICTLKWAKVVAVVLMATVPVLFAGDHYKCTETTQDCLDHMAAKMKTTGWVGVELEKDDDTGALTIVRVVPGSPAEAAGMMSGDTLFAVNGVAISDKNEEALKKAKKDWAPGQNVNYTIKRNGQEKQIALTLAPMPADVLAKFIGQHMLEHASNTLAAK